MFKVNLSFKKHLASSDVTNRPSLADLLSVHVDGIRTMVDGHAQGTFQFYQFSMEHFLDEHKMHFIYPSFVVKELDLKGTSRIDFGFRKETVLIFLPDLISCASLLQIPIHIPPIYSNRLWVFILIVQSLST